MHRDRFTARALGIVMAAAAVLTVAAGASIAQDSVKGRQLGPPAYVFSPDIPHDLVTQDVGAIGLQPFVDNLAWETFIALNWPAPNPIVQRGVPDRQNVIGGLVTSGEGSGPTSLPAGPTVWETYKDTNDIYLDPPKRPTSFDTPESIPPACKALAVEYPVAARRTLMLTSKFGELITGDKQADGNRLIDQNGMNVWYEVKLNRVYYDYVVSHRFYNSKNQRGKTISFPYSSNTTAPPATIKVKAAWKVMGLLGSKQPDDLKKFYTTEALVYDHVTKKCAKQLLGLVGLHIVMKTAQLPQWLWATFEHVDNAPDFGTTPPATATFNFYNASCTTCPVNQPPAAGSQTPTQVMRVTPVDSVAAADNVTYQTALKTLRADNVWQNYMLVNAQWGASATPLGKPNQPEFLANTTLETYLQQPVEPNGCINCHGTFAGKTDLDFQLTHAYPRKPGGLLDVFKLPGVAMQK